MGFVFKVSEVGGVRWVGRVGEGARFTLPPVVLGTSSRYLVLCVRRSCAFF